MNKIEFTRFAELDYTADEALNTLCTNLTFAGEGIRRIMMTSCHASEGKSFITMNMMRTFARLGKRVVLVDADLRRSMILPQYGGRLQKDAQFGLTHYLAGMCSAEEVLCQTNIPGAYMVPVGREVNSSLSLLTTGKLARLLEWLGTQFDFVLVDAPPVGMIIDAAEIAKSCDGVLFVISYNAISRREMQEAKAQIERTGCNILGAVLNNVSFDTYASKKYNYKSYYNTHYESDYYQRPSKSGSRGGSRSGSKSSSRSAGPSGRRSARAGSAKKMR